MKKIRAILRGPLLLLTLVACKTETPKFDAVGTFEATEIIVSSEATGKILTFNLKEGDTVGVGKIVATIDPLSIELQKEQIAASMTAIQDLFIETPTGANHYQTPDGPRPYTIHTEIIRIRGQPDETLIVRETRHGPVISDLTHANTSPGGPILAVAMTNLAPGDTSAAGLLALNRATTRAQAADAAAAINGLVQNMTVADRAGIALVTTGRVPIRRGGDGSRPAPGADGSHDWIGWATGAALPRTIDPPSGRVLNANERAAPPDFPVFLGQDWNDDLRARRARELLIATPKHTLASFAAMQTDTLSLFARDTLPRLRALTIPDGLARRAQALLAAWDGTMSPDIPQPLIFNAWMQSFARGLNAGDGAAPWWHLAAHALTAAAPQHDTLLRQSLDQATARLAATYGPDPAAWRWDRLHHVLFSHPLSAAVDDATKARLDVGPFPKQGGSDTVNLSSYDPATFRQNGGPSFRIVMDVGEET